MATIQDDIAAITPASAKLATDQAAVVAAQAALTAAQAVVATDTTAVTAADAVVGADLLAFGKPVYVGPAADGTVQIYTYAPPPAVIPFTIATVALASNVPSAPTPTPTPTPSPTPTPG